MANLTVSIRPDQRVYLDKHDDLWTELKKDGWASNTMRDALDDMIAKHRRSHRDLGR